MIKTYLIILMAALSLTYVWCKPQGYDDTQRIDRQDYDRELEQNRNAKYQFNTDVDDHIQDLTQSREETRDGLKVTGKYSYSDGYVRRIVYYEADDKGYRVTATESVPIGNGPNVDPTGTASVSQALHGKHVSYRVVGVPFEGPNVKHVDVDKRV